MKMFIKIIEGTVLALLLFFAFGGAMRFLFTTVPVFKQIGAALGLSHLSIIDYVLALVAYTLIYGAFRIIHWLMDYLLN